MDRESGRAKREALTLGHRKRRRSKRKAWRFGQCRDKGGFAVRRVCQPATCQCRSGCITRLRCSIGKSAWRELGEEAEADSAHENPCQTQSFAASTLGQARSSWVA